MSANILLFCHFESDILSNLRDQMPAQAIDPTSRSYAIGVILLSLTVFSIFEVFLSFIIGISRLVLIVLLVCMAGAEFLARNAANVPDSVGDPMEVEAEDDWHVI